MITRNSDHPLQRYLLDALLAPPRGMAFLLLMHGYCQRVVGLLFFMVYDVGREAGRKGGRQEEIGVWGLGFGVGGSGVWGWGSGPVTTGYVTPSVSGDKRITLSSYFMVHDSGFRVQGAGFMLQSSRFRIQSSVFSVQNSGFRVQGSGFRIQGSGFGVQCSGFRVQNSDFRVQISRCWVSGMPAEPP